MSEPRILGIESEIPNFYISQLRTKSAFRNYAEVKRTGCSSALR